MKEKKKHRYIRNFVTIKYAGYKVGRPDYRDLGLSVSLSNRKLTVTICPTLNS